MARSICSSGTPVTFFWRNGVQHLHLDCALEALVTAIQKVNRVPNPSLDALNRAAFRRRLKDATRGRLRIDDEVRSIDRPRARIFEIRWQSIAVDERDPVSWMITPRGNALVRLYYVEPVKAAWVVGLHAHEKVLVEGDEQETRRLQDLEIDVAAELAAAERDTTWGVPEIGTDDLTDPIR